MNKTTTTKIVQNAIEAILKSKSESETGAKLEYSRLLDKLGEAYSAAAALEVAKMDNTKKNESVKYLLQQDSRWSVRVLNQAGTRVALIADGITMMRGHEHLYAEVRDRVKNHFANYADGEDISIRLGCAFGEEWI